MEVIEGGGFTLDSDDDDEEREPSEENVCAYEENSIIIEEKRSVNKNDAAEEKGLSPKNDEDKSSEKETKSDATDKQKCFKLPIPDHASDWMEVIEGGGFSLESDEETTEDKKEKDLPVTDECKGDIGKQSSQSFKLPVPDHADDWIEVIEEGGFSLDDQEENSKESESEMKTISKHTSSLPETAHAKNWVEIIEKIDYA